MVNRTQLRERDYIWKFNVAILSDILQASWAGNLSKKSTRETVSLSTLS